MTSRAHPIREASPAPARAGRGVPEVPAPVVRLVERLESAGFESWTVGGSVRDALCGRKGDPGDWDLATRATPQEVQRLFRRTVPLGIDHGTVGIFGDDGILYEVTTFRHDVTAFGRRAVVAFASTLEEDLARRDFTVNAMAWHPLRRELRDPHGGIRDLRDGVLRAVGDPRERFREDYLRILRGLRFAGALGLEIDPGTWDGLVEAVPGIAHLSRERIRDELMRILASPIPSRALHLSERSGVRAAVLPELNRGFTPALLATVDAVRGRGRAEVRMAALLALGCDPVPPPAQVARILARLRLSRVQARRIGAAAGSGPGPDPSLHSHPSTRRRWLAGINPHDLRGVLRLWFAALRAGTSPSSQGDLLRLTAAIRRDRQSGVPRTVGELAIAGRDLLALGWRPGPHIGHALGALLEAVWEDAVPNERAALLHRIRQGTLIPEAAPGSPADSTAIDPGARNSGTGNPSRTGKEASNDCREASAHR